MTHPLLSRRRLVLGATATGAALGAVLGVGAAGAQVPVRELRGTGARPTLPTPTDSSGTARFPTYRPWPAGAAPTAPSGFRVARFAEGLDNPRWLLELPNGDVLAAEAATKERPGESNLEAKRRARQVRTSADRITLLRDADGDGVAEERFTLLYGLNQPFGMAYHDGALFVANTDGVLRFPFRPGATRIAGVGEGREILDLPAGGYNNHWTRNLLLGRDGRKLYVSVGSASNVGEQGMELEAGRAAIHEIDLDGGNHRLFAVGLRNPVGMAWNPADGALWTAVNERDDIGDELVPDYITSVRENGDYGWPHSYWGQNEDPRLAGKAPERVRGAITPDYALGAHTASLGLAFYGAEAFPERYRRGAFVGQHGSWNRSDFVGYRVVFVPFRDGRPAGPPEDFLGGFMADPAEGIVHGRPVGVAVDRRGGLLVADGVGDVIWRVSAA